MFICNGFIDRYNTRRSNTGDMRREVDRFKNDLNDMQGILNVVSELVQCTANGNVPNDTINFLRTLSVKNYLYYLHLVLYSNLPIEFLIYCLSNFQHSFNMPTD